MNVLMILTSHDSLGSTGKKTGFWLEEFAPLLHLKRGWRQPYPGLPVWRTAAA